MLRVATCLRSQYWGPCSPDGIVAPNRGTGGGMEEGRPWHGRSAAPSLWKTDLGEMNHLRSKTSRTGLEAVPYLKQVPRPIGCKFGLFLSPSDFSAGAALHYYVFSGLFHLSDSTAQQSCQELDCHHRQHSPRSLDDRNNLLLSQICHSLSSIF